MKTYPCTNKLNQLTKLNYKLIEFDLFCLQNDSRIIHKHNNNITINERKIYMKSLSNDSDFIKASI